MSRNKVRQLSNKIVQLRSNPNHIDSNRGQATIRSANVNLSEIVQIAHSQVECAGGVCEILWKPSKIA